MDRSLRDFPPAISIPFIIGMNFLRYAADLLYIAACYKKPEFKAIERDVLFFISWPMNDQSRWYVNELLRQAGL
jgi:hypothetical protein